MKTIHTQFAQSATCDFEENTWTFLMNGKDYKIVAGEFAIVDKILYERMLKAIPQTEGNKQLFYDLQNS